MENLESKITILDQDNSEFVDYQTRIPQLLSLLKLNKKYENFQKIFESNKNLLIDFNFFKNFDNWATSYFIGSKNSFSLKALIGKKLSKSIYDLLIKWIYFLYYNLCKNLNTTIKMKKINKIRYLYTETNDIIIKLYTENFFDIGQLISFLTFYIVSIELNNVITNPSDIIIKIKNYVLLNSLFYLLKKISIEIFMKINKTNDELDEKPKNELDIYLNFLEYFKTNEEINSPYNKIIMTKYNMIQSLMTTILDNLSDMNKIKNYNNELKNKLINFFSNFFSYGYKKSKILSIFLDYLKKAFINLYSFENNKTKIEQDLFIQAFYIKLIKHIIFTNEEISNRQKIHHPFFNSFLFNGYDSEISFEVKKNDFEKSTLFFSFYILPVKNRSKYELFLVEKNYDNKKTTLCELYIKQTDLENYSLCVKNASGNEIVLKNINIIKNYTTIYISLTFNSDKLRIHCYNGRELKSEEINKEKKLFDSQWISLKFGMFQKKSNSAFHGYIGPIIIIKNPKPCKDFKLADIISLILFLEKHYKNFIYIKSNSSFNFYYFKIFQNNDFPKSIELAKKINTCIDKKENFNCLLYLTPDLLKLCKFKHLPEAPNICEIQKEYKIQKINVTLTIFEDSLESFIIDDGLNYISLLFEYIYQLIYNYNIVTDEEYLTINDYKDNNDFIFKNIISIFKKSLFFLDKNFFDLKYSYFKKTKKQIFTNLFLCLKMLIQQEQIIIDELLNYFYNLIVNYRSNIFEIINQNNIILKNNSINLAEKQQTLLNIKDKDGFDINNLLETYSSFRDGLLDIILSPELYDENNSNALLTLFNKITSFLKEDEKNQYSNINEYIFSKLLNFTKKLVNYFDDYKIKNKCACSENNSNSNNIINSFLKVLKIFFESDKKYFKLFFQFIQKKCSDNNQIICTFFNFLNNLTHDEFKIYLKYDNEKDGSDPIKLIMNNSEKLIKLKKNDKEILKIILCTLTKIVFSKITINFDKTYIERFENFLDEIKTNDELTSLINDEVIKEIQNLLENELQIKEDPKSANAINYEQLKNISDFYMHIFDFIFYLFQDNKEEEELNKLYLLLSSIEQSIKAKIDNAFDITNNEESGTFTLDTIYCIINFIKFYNNIIFEENLFNKICDEKYAQNFINICWFAYKTCLINTNILIEVEILEQNITKTLVEIIFDNCFYFMMYSNLSIKNDDGTPNIKIIRCQEIIYDFIDKTIIKLYKNKKNGFKSNCYRSIYYINDYFRFLNSLQNEKNCKNFEDDNFFKSNIDDFKFYAKINKLLTNENKFECNFITFHLLKLVGYQNLISNFLVANKIDSKNNKISLLYPKLIEVSHKISEEHDELYKKNKDFFFKSNKNNTSFEQYKTVKSLILDNIKQKLLTQMESDITNDFFNEPKNYEKIYLTLYSGQCKIENKKTSFSIFKFFSNNNLPEVDSSQKEEDSVKKKLEKKQALSSDNLANNINNNLEMSTTSTPIPKKKSYVIINVTPKSSSDGSKNSDSILQNDNLSNSEEDLKLCIEEEEIEPNTNNSNNYSSKKSDSDNKKNVENNINDSNQNENDSQPSLVASISSPVLYRRKSERTLTSKSNSSISENTEIYLDKANTMKKLSRKFSKISQISDLTYDNEKINTHLCFFDTPDECYIQNAKKEYMSNIFALYFMDVFYKNELFIKLKYYYLQNFNDVKRKNKFFDFPCKLKNFSNGLEPNLFLKPFKGFFKNTTFPITHEYFYNFIVNNNLPIDNIFLFQKELPNIRKKTDNKENLDILKLKCELIKVDQEYFGNIVTNEKQNFLLFEEKTFDYSKYCDIDYIINKENNIFSLSFLNKKPMDEKELLNHEKVISKTLDKDKNFSTGKKLIIVFSEIEEILERRFLFMWQGVEIFLKNGKSYFFNLLTTKNYSKLKKIFEKNKLTKNKIHTKDFFKQHKITNEWESGLLPTYEYLLLINKYSSRTFNDGNQYPIFPWLVIKYSKNGNPNKYRDLKYPISAQTKDTRETALTRYMDDESEKKKHPSHFGTHYSTASYIYFYLMREEPYNTLLVKLQSYKNENADRMFADLNETIGTLNSGIDNRECIPELFSEIEQFINLNCNNYSCNAKKRRIDDFRICFNSENKDRSLKSYVSFIIKNRNIINEKKVSNNLSNWIDNVFGVYQLPESKRKESCNVFNKNTYAQKINLQDKLEKLKNQNKHKDILKKISFKINLIISFGETPQQIFEVRHPKIKDLIQEEDGEFESTIDNALWNQKKQLFIEKDTLYFEINDSSEKIYLLDKNRKLSMINTNLFNTKCTEFKFEKFYSPVPLPHIKFLKKTKIEIKENKENKDNKDNKENVLYDYILKPKYSISSFNTKESYKNNDDYESYYQTYLESLNKKSIKSSKKNSLIIDDFYRIITCRYSDNSFKIIQIPKGKYKKDDIYVAKPITYFCEDFVSSCCAISPYKFLIGLRNGKLIQWSFYYNNDKEEEKSSIIKLQFNRQIQAHKSSINVIEIDKRLGIIITAGEDNFVFIRKLYDFELITPIKINNKYIITMIKISPINFLYIMCYHKLKKKSKIFGYTLNGIPFAKSNFDYYVTLDCTKNGNIVTLIKGQSIEILKGANLKEIKVNKEVEFYKFYIEVIEKVRGSNWIQFKYFLRKNGTDSSCNKIITYINYDVKGKYILGTLDVNKIDHFD